MITAFRNQYMFLSNFYIGQFVYDGKVWKSAEHAFQAQKQLDPFYQSEVQRTQSPVDAKRMGKTAQLRPDWEDVRIQIMRDIVRAKFANPIPGKLLMDTYPHELVEGNTWHDTFWGKCHGIGRNHLGIILMQVRLELNTAQQKAAQ